MARSTRSKIVVHTTAVTGLHLWEAAVNGDPGDNALWITTLKQNIQEAARKAQRVLRQRGKAENKKLKLMVGRVTYMGTLDA